MDMAADPPAYPLGWERTVLTRDNAAYRIRPIRSDDGARERTFIKALSPESRYTRVLHSMSEPTEAMIERLVHVDYVNSMAFLAVVGEGSDERIIGVARYTEDAPARGEFAIAVMDEWQTRGVAGTLSKILFAYARLRGVQSLHATVLATNHTMIELAQWLGMLTRPHPQDWTLVEASCSL